MSWLVLLLMGCVAGGSGLHSELGPAGSHCAHSWFAFQHHCYWASDFVVPWRSVEAACQFAHPSASPASIHSEFENSALDTLLDGNTAWLGLSRPDASSAFVWSDGSQLNFTYWSQHQPGNSNCAITNANNVTGQWVAVSCDQEHLFTCKYQPPAPPPCPEAWTLLNDTCYVVSNQTSSPTYLENACSAMHKGASPVSIHSSDVNDLLESMAVQSGHTSFWIGLFRTGSGQSWRWRDGSIVDYENWDNTPSSYDLYGYMKPSSYGDRWESTDSTYSYYYFCELKV